jgi:uncharacterized protein GlcG (DUF336 family)
MVGQSLSLEEARRVIDVAFAESRQRGGHIAAAVVGSHGELIAAGRLDGARHYLTDLAYGKAIASAICDEPSSYAGGAPSPTPQPRIGVSSVQERASGIYGQRVVWAAGAVPLHRDGVMVGAIGIASLSAADDEEIAAYTAKLFESSGQRQIDPVPLEKRSRS